MLFYYLRKLIPRSVFSFYHYTLALAGAFLYWFPSREMLVVGVTGTNGKSTVVELVRGIFEEAGFTSASLSSIREVIDGKEKINTRKMTMPGRFAIQKFLRGAKKKGVTHVVIEATSEGARQMRHLFIAWDAFMFLNLSPEHIESHGSFGSYQKSKEKLFEYVKHTPKKSRIPKVIIANAEDARAKDFLKYDADTKIIYALKPVDTGYARIIPEEARVSEEGILITIAGVRIQSHLLGDFNASNILAAIAVCRAYGIDWKAITRGIEKVKTIPGRLEIIVDAPRIIVDYAHTPVALRSVYKTLRNANSKFQSAPPAGGGGAISKQSASNQSSITNYKLICVLGAAGGGRDRWKRKEFGSIVSEYCDKAILTNEDPYDENPSAIISDIEIGIKDFQEVGLEKIIDRREAIRRAVGFADKNDTVIITGKGSEQWIMEARGKKTPWDDRKVAYEEYERIKKTG